MTLQQLVEETRPQPSNLQLLDERTETIEARFDAIEEEAKRRGYTV